MGNFDHLITLLIFCLGISVAILAMIFVLVPLLKGFGWAITGVFRAIGWLVMHLVEYVGGTLSDVVRLVGSILAMLILAPLAPLNVVIGRWSAAGHFAESVKRECKVALLCIYRALLRRPLKLFWLHGLLEGIEERVPEAFAAAPTSDQPSRRTGAFEGYTIVGSLASGGSGGKLYIAEPDERKQVKQRMPDRVVIKSFAISDGSSLPQIVRESRALEAAKQLGLVLEHGMEDHRFWYVMPYLPGENLGMLARHIHAESGERGLTRRQLATVMSYMRDLLDTLARYHEGGLWHKDVKPDNIIINEGRAHLVDLGLVTPLHSAMTLTTHGTEYFRDPELVRQALRGVKVHQVNGAKFDIFAAGAVLYFVLENTFPAHGGLSRFSKPSPEALRWIVRRAMAEYNKRYETVNQLMADLQVVMRASDPFAVKPVDLPSMSGGGQPVDFEDHPERDASFAHASHHAGSPQPAHDDRPSSVRGWGVRFGSDGVRVGRFDGNNADDANSHAGKDKKHHAAAVPGPAPLLRVTNWFTGRYDLLPGSVPVGAAHDAARDQYREYRHSAQQHQQQAEDLRAKVASGVMTARQAARLQIKSARQRAKEMRHRAHDRRRSLYTSRSLAERQPSLALIGATVVVIGLVIGAALLLTTFTRSTSFVSPIASGVTPSSAAVDPGPPVLVLTYVDNADNSTMQRTIERALRSYRNNYHLIHEDNRAAPLLSELLQAWRARPNPGGPADTALEDAMELHNYFGIIEVRPGAGNNRNQRVQTSLVYSSRPDADKRRRPVSTSIASTDNGVLPDVRNSTSLPSTTLLLINDHPARTNPTVTERSSALLNDLTQRGWTIVIDDEIEPRIRADLPVGPLDMSYAPERAARLLQQHNFAGIVRLTAGEQRDDVTLTHVLIDPAMQQTASDALSSTPPPPAPPSAPTGANSAQDDANASQQPQRDSISAALHHSDVLCTIGRASARLAA